MPHDQRETPYLDAALRYRATGFTPFQTPGHKAGKGAPAGLREFVGETGPSADLAMAGGVEDTRESTHLIRLAEDYAAEAWGAERTWFLVNGSTSGIHALVLTLCSPGDTVIVPRNAHKSMLAGLIFSGAMPLYMEPAIDPLWGIPLNVCAADALAALAQAPDAKALFVTSPTYNGLGADLPAIAALAHDAGVPFVTDQAWGPHLRFCPELPVDAMSAGADAAVVSTHKLISGLTQSSVLMARGERINLARLDGMVHLTQSTSPQVLMYASIDAAREQMAVHGAELWRGAVELAEWARAADRRAPRPALPGRRGARPGWRHRVRPHTAHGLRMRAGPLRIRARDRAARRLPHRGRGGRPAQHRAQRDLRRRPRGPGPARRVAARPDGAVPGGRRRRLAACSGLLAHTPPFTRQVLSPREAFFAPAVALPLAECAGRVSAEMVTPYPPGIPVLGPGEEVSAEIVAYLQEAAAAGLKVHGPEDRALRSLRVVA